MWLGGINLSEMSELQNLLKPESGFEYKLEIINSDE